MSSKPTPGPWHIGKDHEAGIGRGYFVSGGGFARADLTGPTDAQLANATLIAAAPDLVEALQELNAALDDGLCNSGTPGFDSGRLGRAQDAARAALSKAGVKV